MPVPAVKYYIIAVFGGVEPTVHGPFESVEQMDEAARRVHAEQNPDSDSVFWARVDVEGYLSVESYSAAFFEEQETPR